MTNEQIDLMLEARDSISAARILLETRYPNYAASRAYYAMFYVAQAFLEGEELAFSKHSAVIAAFGREFAHTGKVPTEFHRFLLEAQELRHVSDYGPRHVVDEDQAAQQISRAERLLQFAEEAIGPLPTE